MAIGTARNKKLQDALKSYHQKVEGIPEYLQYTVETRPQYRKADKDKIVLSYRKHLQTISDELQKEQEVIKFDILKRKNGNLNKTSYGSSALHQTAAIEFNSALMIANNLPPNIEEIIADATSQNRTEFVTSLKSLLLGKELKPAYRLNVETAMKKSDEAFGITELETKLNEVSVYVNETLEYKNLLENDTEAWDRKAQTQVKLQEMNVE